LNNERIGFIGIFALVLFAASLCAEVVSGIFNVTNSSGQIQITLDGSDGSVKYKKERKYAAGVNTIVEASDGTDVGGMTEYGVPLVLDSGNAWGTFTSAAQQSDPTASISVTFDNAEGDTVTPGNAPGYEILLVTTGMTPTYGATKGSAFVLGDKYANSFEIRNPAGLEPPIGGVWFKFRTSNISP